MFLGMEKNLGGILFKISYFSSSSKKKYYIEWKSVVKSGLFLPFGYYK